MDAVLAVLTLAAIALMVAFALAWAWMRRAPVVRRVPMRGSLRGDWIALRRGTVNNV